MRQKLLQITLGLIVMVSASISANASTVEDDALTTLSDDVSSVVYQDRSFDAFKDYSCKLVGEQIVLSDSPAVKTYFLTTADACGWGAALGPIWVVKISEGIPSIALSAGGYSIDIVKAESHGMRDVKIGGGTAGRSVAAIYKFNGKIYKKIAK